jgi:N-acetylglucosamine-6-sulfatase
VITQKGTASGAVGRKGKRAPGRVMPFRGRLLIPLLAALGVTGVLAVGPGAPPASQDQAQAQAPARPNVLVIETDDQTLESMRVMANVNSLIGDRGARFANNFVNHSLCCPSRATFLTGQYEHNHGVVGNVPPDGGFSRFNALHGEDNLAVWLQDAGYYTALVGKYLSGYANNPAVPSGWSEWYAAASGFRPETNAFRAYDYTLNENGTAVQYGQNPADFKQDVLTRKAVNFVSRRAPRAQPFFLWLTYTAPHYGGPDPNPQPPSNCKFAPKPAPRHAHAFDSEPFPERPNFDEADVSDKPAAIRRQPRLDADEIATIRRRYRCELESLLSVDEGVKKLVDTLRVGGELGNTLIAYTSDNGFFHGEHRVFQGKQRIYEESIRVPLQMRGPGIAPGTRVDELSINADLAPTIVAAANASPGLVMDGQSLISIVQQPRREVLLEAPSFNEDPSFTAIRSARYKYAEHGSGEKELYDLQSDPFELRNRHGHPAYAAVEAQLAARLQELEDCAGPSCRAGP